MTSEFIIKKEVEEYIDSAKAYCKYVESPVETDTIDFLKNVRLLLLEVYKKALSFPLYNGDSNEDVDDLLGDQYFTILNQICQNVGEKDYYNKMFDPTGSIEDKPVGGLLSDDLGDIYRDLKRALLQLDSKSKAAEEDALWSLHFLFRSHYGEHIINALYAIHFFLQYE